ncbi:hypothetical protein TanjilG_13131 [Lupinus angustifolius]|uniref:BZIP domain-containing protein n=1 Tax=Lupinus angustifolius TaxID=3871 RepID=A0A1J7GT81_LUPAN|nr:PREDICTED: ABSCISIC ACID-INSENSITIVE 5-like protein 7 [Lupinus angustifolius]XP_019423419.1 PREDICTED: ABSCISIC ACID-INSENSITIVE 5-like protein 7 [Lupinus angustifolius]OIV93304.1 hypothetical protein TanjilG_13131 [Lupinus angustifolius]
MNFRSYSDNPNGDGMNGKPPENVSLMRQSSIYSLTFDELEHTMGGFGKDFGSMNMDELLKSILTAEEAQAMASSGAGGGGDCFNPSVNLQRQGSITLPRTLSQKKVDEVWRDLIKNESSNVGSSLPQRQPTLGEITLEEFLARAGVVREDMPQPQPQQIGRPNNNAWFGDFSRPNNSNTGLILGFQQPNTSNGNLSNNRILDGTNLVPEQIPPSLSLTSNHSKQHQQPPLFPKPANVAFATVSAPMHLLSNAQLAGPGTRGGVIGFQGPSMNGTLAQSRGLQGAGMGGLITANVTAPGASPARKISPDVIANSNVDTSPLPPVPYVINRGRKCSAVEKVVERRQRRMIKNRESAARSRARKQAYTFELEAEVAKLKELNQELQRKQAEIMKTQQNQDLDPSYRPWISKRQCLRRTLTGPW